MKKIDTTNISGLAKAPFIKDTHDHIKESIQETTSELAKGLIGVYTTGDIVILWGCVVDVTSGSIPGTGTATLTAGAVYYNGEIYAVDANAALETTNPQTLIWEVATTYASGDPVVWSDATSRNLHQIDKLQLVAGTVGAGLADYDESIVNTVYSYATYKPSVGVETGIYKLREKIIEIGDWDMDTTATISVTHLVDYTKIRSVSIVIKNDAATSLFNINSFTAGVSNGAFQSIDGTNVNLERTTGGLFDSTDYNSTSFNRGFITIQYEV